MRKCLLRFSLLTCVVLAGGPSVFAGDPKEEPLPSPRPVPAPVPVKVYSYPRRSRYEVWQNYGVDHYGRFRPLVIYSPYGPYYRYNGEPYPWFPVKTWEMMPYIVGGHQ
jgi:hypothetical protein